MRIAVIPARGGSKRIPRKNLRPFLGKPIMAYSIDAARNSGLFDHIVVSTDDDEIAALAQSLGAEVPFRRPAALSDDHTGTNTVARHALDWFESTGQAVTEVCCLYATAPFVVGDDLKRARDLLKPDFDFVFAAARFEFAIQRALVRDGAGLVQPMFPQWIGMRSQDLPEALHDAGQFYWGWPQSFREHPVVFLARAAAYELPSHRVQDIDTPDDWIRAEQLFRISNGE